MDPGMNLLRELASPENIYSPLIRTLYLDTLSPSFYPAPDLEEKQLCMEFEFPDEEPGYWLCDPKGDETKDYEAEELQRLLKLALESLHGLETIV
jgi:hypothetical protein